jgi:hypothetical protein
MRHRPSLAHMRCLIAVPIAILVLAGTASAADGGVVPPDGKVAGRDYAGWLAKWWQVRLATGPAGSICRHVGRVEVLLGAPFPKGPKRCQVPAGRTVYVNGPAAECSTVEKAPSHGGTDAQLKRCAKRGFKAVSATRIRIDGRRIHRANRWIVATRAYSIHLPRVNVLGATKRHGRSAAYGSGFLLEGLGRGQHTIRETGTESGHRIVLRYRLNVL